MTGKADYLHLCSASASVLMDLVKENGMAVKQKLSDGEFLQDDVDTRTSQDLAYGMTGIAFYYYLTHDEKVLEIILKLWDFIYKTYYAPGKGIFTWLPQNGKNLDKSVELVAQLDQLYAYMLWLTPSLPKEHKKKFKAQMKNIANIMIERFYSEVYGTFWGAGTSTDMRVLGTAHTDFGHSVKAMWVIYQIGIWVDEIYFVNFAREKIHAILEAAFDEDNGSWNRRVLLGGEIDKDKEWWSLAELDQATAMLAIKDPSYLQYINKTYKFWFDHMVDKEHGEVWHVLDSSPKPKPKRTFPKAHCWKNGLHSLEHALFGYLTSQQILGEEFSLYFAFKSVDEVVYQTVTPYLFKANIVSKEPVNGVDGKPEIIKDGKNNRKNIKVTFESLH